MRLFFSAVYFQRMKLQSCFPTTSVICRMTSIKFRGNSYSLNLGVRVHTPDEMRFNELSRNPGTMDCARAGSFRGGAGGLKLSMVLLNRERGEWPCEFNSRLKRWHGTSSRILRKMPWVRTGFMKIRLKGLVPLFAKDSINREACLLGFFKIWSLVTNWVLCPWKNWMRTPKKPYTFMPAHTLANKATLLGTVRNWIVPIIRFPFRISFRVSVRFGKAGVEKLPRISKKSKETQQKPK